MQQDLKNFPKALSRYQLALDQYQISGDPNMIAHALRHIADLAFQSGNYTLAEKHFKKAINLYTESADTKPLDLANAYRGYALLLEKTKNHAEAIENWKAAKKIVVQSNDQCAIDEINQKLDGLKPSLES